MITRRISTTAVKFKNNNGNPPMTAQITENLQLLRGLWPFLQTEVHMTPRLRDSTRIDKALEILQNPIFLLPADVVERATEVYQFFVNDRWGAHGTDDNEVVEPVEQVTSTPTAGASTQTSNVDRIVRESMTTMRLPPADHPIWGVHGIMHGLALKPGRRVSYIRNPRLLGESRNAKVFGHNGLAVGTWFPFQLKALFDGAHGASVAGISGHAEFGAYSVVISGMYDDLDRDEGDRVWYSADGSHTNVDNRSITHMSNSTRSLHTSLANGNPVRLLRSSKGKYQYAPSIGIRYDGLYRVTASRQQRNANGGLYEQFRLERMPGQPPLADLYLDSPTQQQRADFERIDERY
jgi:hypothetical protein